MKKGRNIFLICLALSSFMFITTLKAMSNVQEIWKDAFGYEGLYQVSDHGRMRSIDRKVINKLGHPRQFKGKIIFQSPDNKGYMKVGLWRDNKTTTKKVHRFVAIAFIDNPEKLPQVNHKDGNKGNANASNLEWCTNQFNQIHSFSILGRKQKSGYDHRDSKPVYQISLDGFFLAEYGSINEAQRKTGVPVRSIINSALGVYKKSRSQYLWVF